MKCLCGSNEWVVADNRVIVSVEVDGKMRADRGHKLAMMTCYKCGRVEFYHIEAVKLAVERMLKQQEIEV